MDQKEAIRLYKLAIEQGHQNNLAMCYENGEGVERDFKEALRFTNFRLKHNTISDFVISMGR